MWFLVVPITAVLGLAAAVVIQVDDRGRDFVTNVAETSWTATDPELRSLEVQLPLSDAADLIATVGVALPRWTLIRRVATDATVELHFVRSTRLFRFRDDITVRVEDRGDRRDVSARSASRVGSGDLGQNPRNLKELLRAVRAALERAPERDHH